jgi:hypothetical protein
MKSAFRTFLYAGAFFGIPLLIVVFLGFHAISLEEEYRRVRAADLLERDTSTLIRQIDPLEQARLAFFDLRDRLARKPVDTAEFMRLWAVVQKKYGIPFEPYLFDSRGKVTTPEEVTLKSRFAFQKFWEVLCGKKIPAEQQKRNEKTFRQLFGIGIDPAETAQRPGLLERIRGAGMDGAFFWERLQTPHLDGVIFIAWQVPSPSTILQAQLARGVKPGVSLLVREERGALQEFGLSLPIAAREAVLKQFDLYKKRWAYDQGMVWVTASLQNMQLVVGRTARGIDQSPLKKQFLVTLLALTALLVLIWKTWLMNNTSLFISIRLKLTGLFGFAILIPLVGVLFLGYQALRGREEVLTADALKAGKDTLLEFDEAFLKEPAKYLRLYRAIRDELDTARTMEKTVARIQKLRRELRVVRMELRDVCGKMLFTTAMELYNSQMGPILEAFAKKCIEMSLQDRLARMPNLKPSAADVMAEAALVSPALGLNNVIQRPNEVHILQMGDTHTFWYWDVFKDPDHPFGFMMIGQSIPWARQLFVKEHLGRRASFLHSSFRVFAREKAGALWYPCEARPSRAMKRFMDRAQTSKQAVFERLRWRGRPYLAIGLAGQNLAGFSLMALYPEGEIQAQLTGFRRGLGLGIFLALFIAVFTGSVLAENFLVPIAELSQGIKALRARNTAYRVPFINHDELGALALTFNHMMEDVKEMELAKVIQESLIPRCIAFCDGYQIELVNKTASDLGGDYCDVVPMSNGRFLLLIGDVSGHGASSALLMAMAKAIVFDFTKRGESLTDLINRLHDLIFNLLNRKKIMTCFLAILDPLQHSLTYANAGHPYPLLVSETGNVIHLKAKNYPLGAVKKLNRIEEFVVPMNPGDVVFMYTDGLIESLDHNQVMFGYERTIEVIQELRPHSVIQIRDQLLDIFWKHQESPVLSDDVTFIILKRTETPA